MKIWTIFALIKDSIVKNIIVGEYYTCNNIAMQTYGNDAFAVEVTQIPVQIDDLYENGNFKRYNKVTREYEIIKPIPTVESEVSELHEEMQTTNSTITEMEIAMDQMFKMIVE